MIKTDKMKIDKSDMKIMLSLILDEAKKEHLLRCEIETRYGINFDTYEGASCKRLILNILDSCYSVDESDFLYDTIYDWFYDEENCVPKDHIIEHMISSLEIKE